MWNALMWFGLGWYFGRNPGAQQQVMDAGTQLLNTATQQLNTKPVQPDATPVCKPGYTYWPQYERCLDPYQDAKAREEYAQQQAAAKR